MKILAVSNLYPPHHAGTFDLHCHSVVEALRKRGHSVQVLTSSHGLRNEQRDGETERRLRLNGVYGHPAVKKYGELKALELHNHQALRESVSSFHPDIIQVFSLHGLSKSLIFEFRATHLPTVFDICDYWLSAEVQADPWLRFWNAPSLPFLENSVRKALEVSGERGRMDGLAPTRLMKGYERIPGLYGDGKERAGVKPNSVTAIPFDRLYFCSIVVKQAAEQAGFCVNHADIIHPGIPTQSYFGEIKEASVPVKKFLIVGTLNEESGVLTALKALKKLRDARFNFTLSIYGRGDSSFIADVRSFVVTNQLPVEFLTVSNLNVDMPSIYKRHDVLLHTPEWAEPYPITPLEAMACGLPVIGTAIGGADELFRHAENALTYLPGDVDQLALRMQEIHMSPALRCQMAETAQEEVLSKYNDAAITDQIEDTLTQAQEGGTG